MTIEGPSYAEAMTAITTRHLNSYSVLCVTKAGMRGDE